MKCLICSNEIDELKAFPSALGPSGQVIEDVMGQWKHQQALGTWTHVMLTAQTGGGSLTVLSGHICPAHPVKAGSVALIGATIPPSPSSKQDGKTPAATPKGKDTP